MPKPIPLPTQAELHRLFDYSFTTGELTRKVRTANNTKIGDNAASKNKAGYLRVRINSKEYGAHRIVWRWVTGEDPGALQVDHINEIKDCNAWHNLRVATHTQNKQNTKKTKGYWLVKHTGKYQACIVVNGTSITLGCHATEAEAAAAYKKASLKYHGEFSRYSQN